MKKIIIAITVVISTSVFASEKPSQQPTGYCDVVICNKIKRFSLDPMRHLNDHLGKTCFPAVVGRQDAVRGKVLNSESRWYQGSSINPTKRSETWVESVGACKG